MKALILVGGVAERLGEIGKDIHKCMLDIHGKPFLYYQFENLKKYGIKDIVLCVGYLKEQVKEFFGDGSKFGVNIEYSEEKEPLGTGGAIKNAEKFIDGKFIVMNGDIYSDINFDEFIKNHKNKSSLSLIKIYDCSDFGTVEIKGDKVFSFKEKEDRKDDFVSVGFYIFEKEVLDYIEEGKVSLEYDVFPKLVSMGLMGYYIHEGEFIDIGVPDRLEWFKKLMEKNKELEDLKNKVEELKEEGKKIVFTNGAFDLLHVGHVETLEKAKSFGDVLIVGLNGDEYVKKNKGEDRPVYDENERLKMLKALKCVDYALIFREDTAIRILEELKPDVHVKGGSYIECRVQKEKKLVESYGGEYVYLDLVNGVSTTKIVEKIKNV